MRFAARTLQGLREDGGREEILIWIERRPGALWAVGRAIVASGENAGPDIAYSPAP